MTAQAESASAGSPAGPEPEAGAALVRAGAEGLAEALGGVARARRLRFTETSFDRAAWTRIAQEGWAGARLPVEAGGTGLGMGETCAAMEAFGAALLPEPLIPAVLSAALLRAAGAEQSLTRLLAGEVVAITAWQQEIDGLEVPGDPMAPRLFTASAFGADRLLVPVHAASGLALVEVDARDVEFIPLRHQDGTHSCTVRGTPGFRGTTLASDVAAALDHALDEAALMTAAHLLGLAEAAFAMTLDYLRTRRQFDRPIGGFQALQHRAVDMKIQLELTRAAIGAAADAIDRGAPPSERSRAVSGAKARAGDAALLVTREAIQMHGAVGYTDEHDIGLFLRRAMTLAGQYGSARWHRARFARLSQSGGLCES